MVGNGVTDHSVLRVRKGQPSDLSSTCTWGERALMQTSRPCHLHFQEQVVRVEWKGEGKGGDCGNRRKLFVLHTPTPPVLARHTRTGRHCNVPIVGRAGDTPPLSTQPHTSWDPRSGDCAGLTDLAKVKTPLRERWGAIDHPTLVTSS